MIHAIGSRTPEIDPTAWIAPNATVIGSVRILAEASVWFGAVIRGDNDRIRIGARTNIQDGCVLHTDDGIWLEIGDGVTVGHMAMLHGCVIGNGALVGIGSILLNHSKIGEGSILGARTLVPEGKEIPPNVLAYGSPVKVIRDLDDQERQSLRDASAHYVAKAQLFRNELGSGR
jgi:carbonic anhydrase/acetyltransferase-like protein (isoleucine patch superfamily)